MAALGNENVVGFDCVGSHPYLFSSYQEQTLWLLCCSCGFLLVVVILCLVCPFHHRVLQSSNVAASALGMDILGSLGEAVQQ